MIFRSLEVKPYNSNGLVGHRSRNNAKDVKASLDSKISSLDRKLVAFLTLKSDDDVEIEQIACVGL